jgi:hypothetical protein
LISLITDAVVLSFHSKILAFLSFQVVQHTRMQASELPSA